MSIPLKEYKINYGETTGGNVVFIESFPKDRQAPARESTRGIPTFCTVFGSTL
jgi:hypothetical protein